MPPLTSSPLIRRFADATADAARERRGADAARYARRHEARVMLPRRALRESAERAMQRRQRVRARSRRSRERDMLERAARMRATPARVLAPRLILMPRVAARLLRATCFELRASQLPCCRFSCRS